MTQERDKTSTPEPGTDPRIPDDQTSTEPQGEGTDQGTDEKNPDKNA